MYLLLRHSLYLLCCLLCIPLVSVAQTPSDLRQVDSLVRIADSLDKILFNPLTEAGNKDSYADSLARYDTSLRHLPAIAQATGKEKYVFKGQVKDANTGEGIPFATLVFPGTGEGTVTDLDGNYRMEFETLPKDTLRILSMGYGTLEKRLNPAIRGERFLLIELVRQVTEMEEFVFHAGEDPALVLLKKIIAAKPANNPDRLANYKYEVYNKLEVDIQHLSKKQFEALPIPMLKQFSFIYDIVDSTSEETPFLPFFLTETLSDYYFQRDPKKTKEFIKASQLKGVKNESVDQFLGAMYQNLNAYDNFIPVFDKSFVSPISNAGAFYYKYKIKDTQMAYGVPIYLVQFRPKRSGENCFFGDFWVADAVWALQRISMEVPKDANINWVSRVSLYQEFAPSGKDSIWFGKKEKFTADFVLPFNVKLPGFIGRKSTSYKNIETNTDTVAKVVNDPSFKTDVILSDSARDYGDDFWTSARHDSLSKNEKAIYGMIDTLQNMPMFIRFKNFMSFVVTGLVPAGPLEFGPYYYIYSRNPVEGPRFRLGMGTTTKLFKDIYLNGYLAYGTKDDAFKYKVSGLWLLKRHPRMYLYGSYTSDVDRSTSYYDEVSSDNIFSNFVRKPNIPWKLAYLKEYRFEFFNEYYNGFSHQLYFLHRNFNPYAPLPASMFLDEKGQSVTSATNAEVGIRLRYAWKERFLEGDYLRVSLGSEKPIIEFRGAVGIKGVFGSAYPYQKIGLSISNEFKIAPLGKLYVNLFAGKYFGGALPYPLLEIHPGNEFYTYNKYAFNMMNRYEFISDEYTGFNIEHTIGGGIFNYIPYFKRLKLRQFWTAKGLYGSLSKANKDLNFDKGYVFHSLQGNPYIEIGTGVENILQFLRLDLVWRVTPQHLPDEKTARNFGVFGSVRFKF